MGGFVPRPPIDRARGGRIPLYPYRQILQTLENHQAFDVPLRGRQVAQVVATIGRYVRRRGLRLAYVPQGPRAVRVWVDRAERPE